jgi:elongation factor P
MYSASDLRKGLKIEIDGVPYEITEFSFMKPGKGQAIYTCRVKNMMTGGTFVKQYRSVDQIDEPKLEEKDMIFSYAEGDLYVFTDENYEEYRVNAEVLGIRKFFLTDGIKVQVLFHNDKAIDVTLPFFIEKRIEWTEPGARGNTATNVQKPAKVEGGYELTVPLFVNQGDLIKIDTRTGEYVDRVLRK